VSHGVPCRSLLIALTVGTILNLINQEDALFAGRQVNFAKILLTFAATYGAVSYRLKVAKTRGEAR
jgi:hypothetical protein